MANSTGLKRVSICTAALQFIVTMPVCHFPYEIIDHISHYERCHTYLAGYEGPPFAWN